MRRTVSTMARAGGWLAGAGRVRVAMMLLLLLFLNSFMARAGYGPWAKESSDSFKKGWYSTKESMSYSNIDQSSWGDTGVGWFEAYGGIGTTVSGSSGTDKCKFGVFSLYTHSELVPPYTRYRMTCSFALHSSSRFSDKL